MNIPNIPNPADSLLEWFNSLADHDRGELAFLTLINIPGSPLSDDIETLTQDHSKHLIDWVKEAKNLPPGNLVGHILALIANIDFFVMDERGTKEAWDQIIAGNKAAQKSIKAQGYHHDSIEPLERIAREAPFRQKQWEKYAASWDELKRGSLSWPALQLWLLQDDLDDFE